MFNLHKYFLLSNKVIYIFSLLSIFVLFSFIMLENNSVEESSLLLYKNEFYKEYFTSGTLVLQVLGILLSVISVSIFFNKQNDEYKNIFIVNRFTKFKYFFTKILFINIFVYLLVTIYFCFFEIVLRLSPIFMFEKDHIYAYFSIIINTFVYLNYSILLYNVFKSELASFMMLVVYWLISYLKSSDLKPLYSFFITSIDNSTLYYDFFYYVLLLFVLLFINIIIYTYRE